jgi:hypothetical protein
MSALQAGKPVPRLTKWKGTALLQTVPSLLEKFPKEKQHPGGESRPGIIFLVP